MLKYTPPSDMETKTVDEYYPIKLPLPVRLKLFCSKKLKCMKCCFCRCLQESLYSPRMLKLTKLYNMGEEKLEKSTSLEKLLKN